MDSFHGKTVIVTGSGAGIGKETAIRFCKAGANVILNSLSGSALEVARELKQSGISGVMAIKGDVSVEDMVRNIVDAAVSNFERIDVVVNAAGIVPDVDLEQCTVQEWDHAMAVNVRSIFLMSKYAIPYLEKTHGNIINIASAVALKGVKRRELYAATKGAVISLSKSIAREYVDRGIRVNCISPGSVDTESLQKRIKASGHPQEALDEMIQRQPVGKLGRPEDIAEAVLFLASDHAQYVTGANWIMDGGMTM